MPKKVVDLRKAYLELALPPLPVIEKTNHAYQPGVRRLADRLDPSYRN